MDTTQSIIVAVIVALIGVWIGGQVSKKSGFMYPWDFVTISLAVMGIVELITWQSGIYELFDPIWLVPFFLGYVAGYCIVGRVAFSMVIKQSFRNKHVEILPWVIFDNGTEYYRMDQSNRALWDRWVHGIHHRILSNAPLEADWTADHKQPLFPFFKNRAIYIEHDETTYVVAKKGKIRDLNEYTTTVLVARASMMSKAALATEERVVYELQTQIVDLQKEIHYLKLEQGPAVMEMAIHMDIAADQQKPENRMYAAVKASEAFKAKNKGIQKETSILIKDEKIQEKEKSKEEVLNSAAEVISS